MADSNLFDDVAQLVSGQRNSVTELKHITMRKKWVGTFQVDAMIGIYKPGDICRVISEGHPDLNSPGIKIRIMSRDGDSVEFESEG